MHSDETHESAAVCVPPTSPARRTLEFAQVSISNRRSPLPRLGGEAYGATIVPLSGMSVESGVASRVSAVEPRPIQAGGFQPQFFPVRVALFLRMKFAIIFPIVAIFLAFRLVNNLSVVSRMEDLAKSGSGLELEEWQISVGILVLALALFSALTVSAFKIRFSIGSVIVSWLALLSVAAATGSVYSAKARAGIMNEHGHGLT
jgi:hypothetical protein